MSENIHVKTDLLTSEMPYAEKILNAHIKQSIQHKAEVFSDVVGDIVKAPPYIGNDPFEEAVEEAPAVSKAVPTRSHFTTNADLTYSAKPDEAERERLKAVAKLASEKQNSFGKGALNGLGLPPIKRRR